MSKNTPVKATAPAKFRDLLTKNVDKIADVAAGNVDPMKLVKIFCVAASQSPKLYQCTPISILRTAMTASELGLTVGGSLGHLYPVPYGKECVPIIGYRGLIKLALRSPNVASIEARNVYAGDKFRIAYHLDPPFEHIPALSSKDRGEYIGSYAVSRTIDGFVQFTWMDVDEINAIRNRSRAGKSGPWVTDHGEMCRKTVTRRHIKYLDLSVEAAESVATAEAAEVGEYLKDVTPSKPANTEEEIEQILGDSDEMEDLKPVDLETGEVTEVADGEELTLDIEEEAGWHGE